MWLYVLFERYRTRHENPLHIYGLGPDVNRTIYCIILGVGLAGEPV